MTNEKSISVYLDVLSDYTRSSDSYTYLMDLQNGRSWFLKPIEGRFDVTKRDPSCDYYDADEWISVLHPKDQPALLADVNMIAAGNKTNHNMEYRVRDKKGSYTWVNCRGIVKTDEAGKPFIMVGRISENALRYRIDSLTGIFNSEQLKTDLEQEFSNSEDGFYLLLGIDNLTNINTRQGRIFGDRMLQLMANELEEATEVRKAYRLEGDLFATYLHGKSKEEVGKFFLHIQAAVSEYFTVSCGAVPLHQLRTEQKQFQQYAEFALDKAKKTGKNNLAFFEQEDYEKFRSDLELVHEFEHSAANGCAGFSIVYQPQIKMENYQLIGAEALLRFTSPSKGRIFPDQFIPILESTQLICPVGLWGLKTALEQCRKWRCWLPDFHISVNISYVQLLQKDFAQQVTAVLEESGLPGDALTLEITESIQLEDFPHYNQIFSILKSKGIRISVDDFGTGYSSLGYLKNLNIDEIKVDRCFVSGIQNSGYNYGLLSNIIDLASNAQIRVCCEGVEETDELQILEKLNPELLQGYYFSKPCECEEFEQKYFFEDTEEYRKYDRRIVQLKTRRHGKLLTLRHHEILQSVQMGLWIIHIIGNGERFEMHADETMQRIMGVGQELSPEECYTFWYNRIRPDCVNYVNNCVGQAIETGQMVQLQYFWNHPQKGEIEVRCAGIRTEDIDGEICLQGYHCNIDDLDMTSFLEQNQLAEQMAGLAAPGNSQTSSIIKAIQAFFYNLNELVYMTDMDTNELIYLNRIALEQFGVQSMKELQGKSCHDVLQNSLTPCTFCTNSKLSPWKFTEWQIFNPLVNKHFLLKDTMIIDKTKRYRLEIAMDITERVDMDNTSQKFHMIEKMAHEGISLALEASIPDDSIDAMLEFLGKALGGDRAYIFEQNEWGHDDNTYEWVASGVIPQKENLQNLPPEVCDVWYRSFESGHHIAIDDLEKIREENPTLYSVLAPQCIRSIVVVPIHMDNKIIGFYGIDNPAADTFEYTHNLLLTIGHFITSSLKRRSLYRQLQELSRKDSFTMLGNRLAMNEYIESIDPEQSTGILYCDITGLKAANDMEGHDAGDKLILSSCKCLRNVFDERNLFRIGGDELLVICTGITEEELNEKTERLRAELKAQSVVMAIGMAFRPDLSGCKAQQLIGAAEKLMYEDKNRYYREHGSDRLRT